MLLFLFLCLDLRFSPHYYVSDRDLNDCSGFLKDLRRGRLKCKLISVVYKKKKFSLVLSRSHPVQLCPTQVLTFNFQHILLFFFSALLLNGHNFFESVLQS